MTTDGTRGATMGVLAIGLALALTAAAGCDGSGAGTGGGDTARATIGPAGGEVVGAPGSALQGVRLTIPAGALATATEIAIAPAGDTAAALPATAVRCGR